MIKLVTMKAVRAVCIALSFATSMTSSAHAASAVNDHEACKLVAEISVEAVRWGSMYECSLHGNAVACAIAAAANDVASGEVAKAGVEAGCNWTVKKIGDLIEITVESNRSAAEEMRRTERSLNAVDRLKVRRKRLQAN